MLRRFLVIAIRRSFLVFLLVCLGCVAQTTSPDMARKIERQVRSYYSIPPDVNIKVGGILPSKELPGYDEVAVTIDQGEGRQKDYRFLVSRDRSTMLRLIKFDLNKDPYQEVMSKIDLTGRPVRGDKNAKVVLVNYDDFECPYCARMHAVLFPELLKEYGDRVAFVYKDYPLTEIHPWAIHAAVDANCLAAQNSDAYWDFADDIHANKPQVDQEKTSAERFDAIDKIALLQGQKHSLDASQLQACIKAQNDQAVLASMKEADNIGVDATPTLFINGEKIDGLVPVSELRSALNGALKDAGQPVPSMQAASAPGSK